MSYWKKTNQTILSTSNPNPNPYLPRLTSLSDNLMSFFNALQQEGVKRIGKLKPALKESKFLEKGVLTPEEVYIYGVRLIG